MPGVKVPIYDEDAEAMPPRIAKIRNFMLILGSLMVMVLVLGPARDAFRLLQDDVFLYFLGPQLPCAIVGICAATLVLYVLLVLLLFGCASPQAVSQHMLLLLVAMVITALGLALLLVSIPLSRQADAAYDEIFFHCATGEQTAGLHLHYTDLEQLRSTPPCMTRASVEECDGFNVSQPYTGFLRTMETKFRCSGFCSPLSAVNATADTESRLMEQGRLPPSVSLIQIGSQEGLQQFPTRVLKHSSRLRQQVSMLATDATSSFPFLGGQYISSPLTLFSQATHQASCDGFAARQLRFGAAGVAHSLYMQGLSLLICIALGCSIHYAGLIRSGRSCSRRGLASPHCQHSVRRRVARRK
mmetsp:Transcript_215/g.571  ORF Transcript_215/g.571 Transcript_215/m.571 type:complete len:357 (+) Transcript_215:89-1159(+)